MLPGVSTTRTAAQGVFALFVSVLLIAGCGRPLEPGDVPPPPLPPADSPQFTKDLEASAKKTNDAAKGGVPRNAKGLPIP